MGQVEELLHVLQGVSLIDIAFGSLLLFYAFEGFSVGFISSLIDSFSFLLSLTLALLWYRSVGEWLVSLGISEEIALPLGFAFILLCVGISLRLIRHFLKISLQKISFGMPKPLFLANQLLGGLFGIVTGVILLTSLVTVLVVLPLPTAVKQALSRSWVAQSLTGASQGLEDDLAKTFGSSPDHLMTFFTIEPQTQESIPLGFEVSDGTVDTAAEKEMFLHVNEARQENHVSSLSLSDALTELARSHGQDMLARGYFSHNTPEGLSPFDRMDQAGIQYQDAGENLAFSQSVNLAMTGLMNSPGHRANILSDKYHKIGIGVIDAGDKGEMFVQEFTN